MERTFEASLSELEKIVKQLDCGDLPLEESLRLFEDGVRLARECRERLTQAERRIEMLLKDAEGNLTVSELEPATLRSERSQTSIKRIVFGNGDEDESPF